MIKYFFVIVFACISVVLFGQASKFPVDSIAISNWRSVDRGALSSDGAWFSYLILNQPTGGATLMIRDIKGLWKRAFVLRGGYRSSGFSGNNKHAVFKDGDTLRIVTLGANTPEYTVAISAFTSYPSEKAEWLAYQPKEQPTVLILRNLFTGSEQRFDSVITYAFANNGNGLLLQAQNKEEKSLQWLNLQNGKLSAIWSSSKANIGTFSLDEEGKQVAFTIQTPKEGQVLNHIWYYHTGMDKAIQKVDENTAVSLEPGFEISDAAPSFSGKGHYIFFKLRRHLPAPGPLPSSDQVKVTIWSFKDKALQSPEEAAQSPGGSLYQAEFTAAVSTTDSRITRLDQEGESIHPFASDGLGRFVITYRINTGETVDHMNEQSLKYYLRSLKDGTYKLFLETEAVPEAFSILFSPKGDYLVYYDTGQQHYFSYNILSGETRNISKHIPTKLTKGFTYQSNGHGQKGEELAGIAGWMADGSLLIYDYCDIWQVDLSGNRSPVNITQGYGQSHHIQFRMVFENDLKKSMNYGFDSKHASLLLTAINKDTKQMGFYRLAIGAGKAPELLTMGPWRMSIGGTEVASNGNWIVQRESPTQSPNYLLTSNFKDCQPLTDIQPHRVYNWMQAELINFKQLDGVSSQGILYKPEDFDPHKKYPLIINYYEVFADEVFKYQWPGFTGAELNIPWFVSRGYLVFRPDIHFQAGVPGGSAFNSVIGGVKELSRMPWVDTARMGLHGHSFGGYETNYIITHSHQFAAASQAAGLIDLISFYEAGSLTGTTTGATFAENALRMGATLWERPDLYVKNSPIFKIDQVTTPLLMMHNRQDINVPWYHGLSQFTSMRRLNKKVWWLQYDEGDHIVWGRDAIDYTTRLTQFFDHYLKGEAPPRWMTEGMAAEIGMSGNAYELDSTGSCGDGCSVCKKKVYSKK